MMLCTVQGNGEGMFSPHPQPAVSGTPYPFTNKHFAGALGGLAISVLPDHMSSAVLFGALLRVRMRSVLVGIWMNPDLVPSELRVRFWGWIDVVGNRRWRVPWKWRRRLIWRRWRHRLPWRQRWRWLTFGGKGRRWRWRGRRHLRWRWLWSWNWGSGRWPSNCRWWWRHCRNRGRERPAGRRRRRRHGTGPTSTSSTRGRHWHRHWHGQSLQLLQTGSCRLLQAVLLLEQLEFLETAEHARHLLWKPQTGLGCGRVGF